MSSVKNTYHSALYREFRAIAPADQRKIIHFFEQHEEAIRGLYPEEVFEMITTYSEALYDINQFRKFLVVADEVIYRSIEQNVVFFQGKDIYKWMLYRKARALLKCLDPDPAEHILRELLRMAPKEKAYLRLLRKCFYLRKPNWVRQARAIGIFLFLLTALVTALEVLFVTPFTPDWTPEIQLVRNSTFGLGILAIVGSDLIHRHRINRALGRFREAILQKKATQS
jgi:hypothetical protein